MKKMTDNLNFTSIYLT